MENKKVETAQVERIMARQVAVELNPEQIELVSGGSSYSTCSGGSPDACDVDQAQM